MAGAINLHKQGVELEAIMSNNEGQTRRTKIFCTIGPACWTVEKLTAMIDAGMNVARFNFSHGDHKGHGEVLNRLRTAIASRPHKHVAIMLDTKGPEIRTGFLATEDKKVHIEKGSIVEWTTDYEFLGDETKLACSYEDLPTSVQVGGTILVADGSLVFEVTEVLETGVKARALNSATLGERKNMNLPGAKVTLPTMTERDEDDIVNWGLVQGVDYIAASFVRTAQDIDNIRAVLGPRGRAIKIIAKIENQEGLQNFDEILEKTDGIMVARGDLGMEIAPEKVFLAQKMMIRKANIAGKPVVTATQMLESMITNPRPTRAECTDVANAVLDGSDAVMLSGETANGDYPIQAVEMMHKTCLQAEGAIHYDELYQAIRNSVLETNGKMSTQEAIASSAVKTAIDMGAKMIVVLTETGTTARLIAKYRPACPILVLTALGETARQCEGFLKGSYCRVMGSMIGTDSILYRATDLGKQFGWIQKGDAVVAIHGMMEARSGSTNMLKVLVCD
ncbi:pyruvate kinase [Saprolegnia diclina VS20]|uniref:Pyruvate kinase n=1 Tax=Saprolegnia diclina (strain VS20) TaxID=1156394 RepID=T0QDQ7_SAPDV|nr:pyruvate kinase [Saprolegnia diclina VS20]EQC31720.1 pyruvate kinase [Saprolegnia diclina VS20]|eukprot:XP_008614727.1 pyruvate kinase [Saprolegnia diclina VS20]